MLKQIKFITMTVFLLFIFILSGCSSSDGGFSTPVNPDPNVGVDITLANNIKANASSISDMYASLTSYEQKTALYTIYTRLYNIFYAYNDGNKKVSYVNNEWEIVYTYKNIFFSANKWLTYEQMIFTENKIQAFLTMNPTYDAAKKAKLNVALSTLQSTITAIKSEVDKNKYYVETSESDLLTTWLESPSGISTYTYREFLKSLNLIDDESLDEKYNRLAQLVKRDIDLLEGTSPYIIQNITSVSNSSPITDLYGVEETIGGTDKTRLLADLKTLYNIYLNYRNYNTQEILTAEATVNSLDNTLFVALSQNNLTYYLVVFADGGQRLTTTVAVKELYTTDLIAELNRIYDANINAAQPKLNPTQMDRLYKIKQNVDYYKKKIELEYNMSKPNRSFTKTVVAMQLCELLKDNDLYIQQYKRINDGL